MNIKTETDLTSTIQLKVGSLIEIARQRSLPFALWRKPSDHELYFLVSFNPKLLKGFSKIEDMPAGFVVSTFANDTIEEAGLIKADLIFKLASSGEVISYQEFVTARESSQIEAFFEAAESLEKKTQIAKYNNHLLFLSDENAFAQQHYTSIVEKAIAAIGDGQFDKVVLSRTKQFQIQDSFDVGKAFLKLQRAYTSAFVSLINLPESDEMWLGASPEILVEVIDQKKFKTIALAGTQAALDADGNLFNSDEVKWGQKEIEEQALVSRYIVSCFKKIRLREYIEKGPKSALAGNLYHLKSDFEVDMVACCFPDLGTVMLSLLHPTSAICGMPKLPAMAFLASNEGYDRSYYSGFIGPVNVHSMTSIYVNLRTVRFKGDRALFYAGAGITSGSDAQKEWIETELKCDTLLRIINEPSH